ncbi:hypothetical protein EB118_21125 [bacterium]|nr:hypothetical protein [bacterium]
MSQHMLTPLDVRDILNEIRKEREDERILESSESNLSDVNESMDGDFDSAMASAGHGTDEDYGGDCYQMEDFGWAGDPEICGE